MWKLIFSIATMRGVGFNRERMEGEFAVDLPPSECAWFASQPGRYQYVNGVFSEVAQEILDAEKRADEIVAIWAKIKAERDKRKSGGTIVDTEPGVSKWFHSDADSRIQQLGLVMAGAAVPAIPWKTMDGSFVQMSQELAGKVFQGAFTLDAALFTKAEQHKVAMEASDEPARYDFSTGWPERFA